MPHDCHCFIIPPHMLEKLSSHPNAKVRQAALATLLTNRSLREQRRFFALASPPLPTGSRRRTVYDARHSAMLPGTFARGEDDGPVDDPTVNEAFDGAGDTYAFYADVLQRKSIDGHGMRLDSTVHYQENPNEGYDNAFWNGRQMVYGDGDGVLFGSFTKSLDVIAHELAHGVTQFEAGLEYHDQPGALNESFSDVFGSLVKQYTPKQKQTIAKADWLIGPELFIDRSSNHALRSLKAPGTAYQDHPILGDDPQPDRMSKYVPLANTPRSDNGGVHINSGIPNHAFYLACVNLGDTYAWDRAGRIWYAALRSLHPTSQFIDAANATVMYADQLFGAWAAGAVREAWETVEVLKTITVAQALPKAG